ncbi:MAG TPA: hypothetical protein VF520_05695 [Thermoleophilaceae bacterium]
MSTEGWIFMVGFRVFDVGLLIVWLVWFFRLRDDDDPSDEDGPGGGGPDPSPADDPGGGGLRVPLGRAPQGRRARDHARPPRIRSRRGAEPLPNPMPARVRQPATPAPAHRRVV